MSKPSDFANANLDEIVEALSQEEAISLTSGVGFWHTAAIPRLGVPAIKARRSIICSYGQVSDCDFPCVQVSDGPNGVRGNHFFRSTPAKVIPVSVI